MAAGKYLCGVCGKYHRQGRKAACQRERKRCHRCNGVLNRKRGDSSVLCVECRTALDRNPGTTYTRL